MTDIPGMQDTAIIATIVLSLVAGAILSAIYLISQRSRRCIGIRTDEPRLFGIKPKQRLAWFAGTALGVALLVLNGWFDRNEDRELAAERELVRLGCPAKQPGDTNVVTLTIDTSADMHTNNPKPRVTGCARYVARGGNYLQLHREAIAKVTK